MVGGNRLKQAAGSKTLPVVLIAGVSAITLFFKTSLGFAHPLGCRGENSRVNVVQSSRVLLQARPSDQAPVLRLCRYSW